MPASHNPGSTMKAEFRCSLCEMSLPVCTRSAGHMHTRRLFRCQWRFVSRGSNMIFSKNVHIFVSIYRQKRATECKSKEESLRKKIKSTDQSHSSWPWCISKWCILTMTCKDVHKLGDLFFLFNKRRPLRRGDGVMTRFFYLPVKMPMKNDKKVPQICLKMLNKLFFSVSCILRAIVHKQGVNTVWQNGVKMTHLSFLSLPPQRETQKNRNIFLSLPISPSKWLIIN